MKGEESPGRAALDAIIDEHTAEAHSDDERIWNFQQEFQKHVSLPCDGFVIGEPVKLVSFNYDGNQRCGVTAICRRSDGREYEVAASEVLVPKHTGGSRYLGAVLFSKTSSSGGLQGTSLSKSFNTDLAGTSTSRSFPRYTCTAPVPGNLCGRLSNLIGKCCGACIRSRSNASASVVSLPRSTASGMMARRVTMRATSKSAQDEFSSLSPETRGAIQMLLGAE
jgi:hypothetical protein